MKKIVMADLDGTLIFGDRKLSLEVRSLLRKIIKKCWFVVITAASVERMLNFFLDPLFDGSKEKEILKERLLLFPEMGLVEIDTRKFSRDVDFEEILLFHLSQDHFNALSEARKRAEHLVWVAPPLWYPSSQEEEKSSFRDYKGRFISFSKDEEPFFLYFILNEEKRILVTLEKIRSGEKEVVEAPKEIKKNLLSSLLLSEEENELEIIEFPTSFEIKPRGWDKSIAAFLALKEISKREKCEVKELLNKTVVLGDTEHDKAMARPKNLKTNLPFIQVKGEKHLLEVLKSIKKETI